MDRVLLVDYLTLAQERSFSRAAERRHVTQPAFSRRIRALEDWVGTELVDRRSHPVGLTAAGEEFLHHADSIILAFDRAKEEIQTLVRERDATLRFSTTQVLALTFFPNWLRSIATKLPMEKINLVSDSLAACERSMLNGDAHFLLCHHRYGMAWRLDAERFTESSILSDRLIPVSAPDNNGRPVHSLMEPRQIALPHLDYDRDAGLGRIFRSGLGPDMTSGILDPIVESHLALIYGLALDGRGLAWVPESVVRTELEQGALVLAGGEEWAIAMDIRLFRPKANLGSAAERFWSLLSKRDPL